MGVVGSGIAFARPQGSDAEAQRRALDGQDMFDPNPVYTYNYQVSNEDAQTYITAKENRDVDGYTEIREVQENFITIRAKPVVKKEVVSTAVVEAKSSSTSDLVATIIAQLTPFIKETVATSLNAQQQVYSAAVPVAVPVQPVQVVATAVESRFGTGAGNNIRVETPEYTFATDL